MTESADEHDTEDARDADEYERWLRENLPPHHI
jgi:hypothetical protein